MTTTDATSATNLDPDEGGRRSLTRTFNAGVHHGGQIIPDDQFSRVDGAAGRPDLTAATTALGESGAATTDFSYLFPGAERLPESEPGTVVASLKALGSAMIEDSDTDSPDSDIPAVYTYFGQFVDHDLTLNTNSDFPGLDISEPAPADPDFVTSTLKNLREPALNLDSLYGSGPGDPIVPYVGGTKLKLGRCTPLNGSARPIARIPGVPGGPGSELSAPDERDLPRTAKIADIGDPRNDENLIVAQLHLAFLHAHNRIVDLVQKAETETGTGAANRKVFDDAQRILRWTYQWLIRNDFLTRIVAADDISAVQDLPKFGRARLFMPLEFATAAFRFGHSMVRGRYDWNRNFGRAVGSPEDTNRSTFQLLFSFTGGGGLGELGGPGGNDHLPDNWPAEWDRMVGGPGAPTDHMARKIDTNLALPLDDMLKEGNTAPSVELRDMLKRLAVRNLLRGYKLAMPTGQAVAAAYGVANPLTTSELLSGGRLVRHALIDGGFVDRTPLWFYILREAEVLGGGNRLGPVGGRIVAETLIGELLNDPGSYLSVEPDWSPATDPILSAAGGPPIAVVADLLRFAGVLA